MDMQAHTLSAALGEGQKPAARPRKPRKSKKAPPQGEGQGEAQLVDLIAAQAQLVRRVKTEEGEGEKWRKAAVMEEIFKLMELKYRYGRLVAPVKVTAPELWVETEPPHEIKIRWAVRQPGGKIVRLQRPFYDVTHITGEQVIETIRTHTHRANHFPSLNGFLKLEIKEIIIEEDKEVVCWRSVLPEDKFCLELRFPGPVLEQEHTFSFRVTWPERTSHLTTPEAYSGCAVLPELVDTGYLISICSS